MIKRGRRRSRPSLAARVRTFWLLGLVALVAIVWGGWTLLTLPALRLKSLAITGLERVSRGDVLARAHIDPTANVWLFDRNAIARRIEVLPFVDTARVHVRPLANVWIDVTERRADACLRDAAGRRMTIDAASRLLEDGCDATLPTTYTVRGKIGSSAGAFLHDAELDALRRDGQTLAADGDRFRLLSHDGFGGLQATMYDGIEVRFGDDGDLIRKQRLIAPILAELGPRLKDVRAVDLRAPATPVVEYRR